MSEKKSSEKRSDPQGCELVLCEDPETGEVIVKPKGKCPPGYVEYLRDKTAEKGLTFLVPKVRSREIDE